MSFTDDLGYLKGLLATNSGIAALFPGKTIKAVRRYKPRAEVHVSDLPIIMITRPRATTEPGSNISGFQDHTVALYFGFNCENREQAQDLLIRAEEAIETCVMQDPTLGGRVMYTSPGNSANDEGKWHPVYFFVKEIVISREVVWQP